MGPDSRLRLNMYCRSEHQWRGRAALLGLESFRVGDLGLIRFDVGALKNRIGFGGILYYNNILRKPQILQVIIQTPILGIQSCLRLLGSGYDLHTWSLSNTSTGAHTTSRSTPATSTAGSLIQQLVMVVRPLPEPFRIMSHSQSKVQFGQPAA